MTRISKCILGLAVSALFVGGLFIPVHRRAYNQQPSPPQSARISLISRGSAIPESQSRTPTQDDAQDIKREDSVLRNLSTAHQKIVRKQMEEDDTPRETDSVKGEEVEAVSVMEGTTNVPMIDGYYLIETATQPPLFDRALLAERIQYPPMARRQRREGLVILRLFILENGVIERVVIEEDPGYGFAQAAEAAFAEMIVSPALLDGIPIPVTLTYPIRFTLQ